MHIPPFDNKNKPIVDMQDKKVPLNYFNIVKLNKDQSFEYVTPGYETCIVPATGSINVNIEGFNINNLVDEMGINKRSIMLFCDLETTIPDYEEIRRS